MSELEIVLLKVRQSLGNKVAGGIDGAAWIEAELQDARRA
jgi:hypothetical protein